MAPLRVVLAEDSYLVREGMAALMRASDELELTAAVDSLPSLLAAVDEHRPEAVVTDIRMPPTNTDEGITAARRIRETHPSMGVLVLSQHLEDRYVSELLTGGAQHLGYLLKERVGNLAELVRALQLVASGASALDPLVVDRLMASRRDRRTAVDELTDRERRVLGLMAEGHTNATIAKTIALGERAVEKHISAIFQKLDLTEETAVHRRVTAVLKYLHAVGEGG